MGSNIHHDFTDKIEHLNYGFFFFLNSEDKPIYMQDVLMRKKNDNSSFTCYYTCYSKKDN